MPLQSARRVCGACLTMRQGSYLCSGDIDAIFIAAPHRQARAHEVCILFVGQTSPTTRVPSISELQGIVDLDPECNSAANPGDCIARLVRPVCVMTFES